ncbi:MAG: energy-coupling factor transporter transmembrane component T [Firmicutes bacterium]|nr:energy-coupling factor transporter transmembrane component T [Bacillota bacterium]MDY5531352.1 energy-coupling factor transporter transmembrane component T [Pumilibacteraceae bacterium]
MREITLGQYYPVSSPIHRLDPRIKLLISMIYLVGMFFVKHFIVFGAVALCVFAVILVSRVPLLKVLKSLKVVIFLLLFTFIMTALFYNGGGELLWAFWVIRIYKEGLINAAFLSLRLILIFLGPTILTYTTTPVELTDALESLLKPLSMMGIPVHYLAIIMQIALRLIPSFIEETDKIVSAQKSRCADFDSGNIFKRAKAMIPVIIPLIISAINRADDLADAMDSRCYRGAKGRTRYKKMTLRFCDVMVLLLSLALLFCVLTISYNWFPWIIDFSAIRWLV